MLKLLVLLALFGIIYANSLCKTNEVYNECASACVPTCKNRYPMCIAMCYPAACQCKMGFFRHNGACISEKECPETDSADQPKDLPLTDEQGDGKIDEPKNSKEEKNIKPWIGKVWETQQKLRELGQGETEKQDKNIKPWLGDLWETQQKLHELGQGEPEIEQNKIIKPWKKVVVKPWKQVVVKPWNEEVSEIQQRLRELRKQGVEEPNQEGAGSVVEPWFGKDREIIRKVKGGRPDEEQQDKNQVEPWFGKDREIIRKVQEGRQDGEQPDEKQINPFGLLQKRFGKKNQVKHWANKDHEIIRKIKEGRQEEGQQNGENQVKPWANKDHEIIRKIKEGRKDDGQQEDGENQVKPWANKDHEIVRNIKERQQNGQNGDENQEPQKNDGPQIGDGTNMEGNAKDEKLPIEDHPRMRRQSLGGRPFKHPLPINHEHEDGRFGKH